MAGETKATRGIQDGRPTQAQRGTAKGEEGPCKEPPGCKRPSAEGVTFALGGKWAHLKDEIEEIQNVQQVEVILAISRTIPPEAREVLATYQKAELTATYTYAKSENGTPVPGEPEQVRLWCFTEANYKEPWKKPETPAEGQSEVAPIQTRRTAASWPFIRGNEEPADPKKATLLEADGGEHTGMAGTYSQVAEFQEEALRYMSLYSRLIGEVKPDFLKTKGREISSMERWIESWSSRVVIPSRPLKWPVVAKEKSGPERSTEESSEGTELACGTVAKKTGSQDVLRFTIHIDDTLHSTLPEKLKEKREYHIPAQALVVNFNVDEPKRRDSPEQQVLPAPAQLAELARHLRELENAGATYHLTARGYADVTGTCAYNLELSNRRAAWLIDKLKNGVYPRGLRLPAVTVLGCGRAFASPRAETEAEREKDRVVVIELKERPMGQKAPERRPVVSPPRLPK